MGERPIMILAAMKIEIEYLESILEEKTIEEENIYTFYKGKINSYPIVIVYTRVGLINISVSVSLAINKYNPICIISQGTAGSHTMDGHIGDIIIGTECINICSFRTKQKNIGEGSNPLEWEILNFIDNDTDRLIVYKSDETLVKLTNEVKEKYTIEKILNGRLGSGDSWNIESDRILWFNKNYSTLCEDMESVAAYIIGENYSIPVIGIRILSDNEILKEEYDRNTGVECQKFVYEVVLNIIQNIDKLELKGR